jgi:Retroviral aspartyl protease
MFFSDDESDDSESITTDVNPVHHPPPSIHLLSEDPRWATEVKVKIQSPCTGTICARTALLDSRATGMFMDPTFVKENGLDICPLPHPIPIYNVDGTLNEMGSVHEEVEVILQIDDHSKWVVLSMIVLGETKLIIGHTWLHHHNPEIDWTTGQITLTHCPSDCCIMIWKLQNAECWKGRKGRNAMEKPTEDPPL